MADPVEPPKEPAIRLPGGFNINAALFAFVLGALGILHEVKSWRAADRAEIVTQATQLAEHVALCKTVMTPTEGLKDRVMAMERTASGYELRFGSEWTARTEANKVLVAQIAELQSLVKELQAKVK